MRFFRSLLRLMLPVLIIASCAKEMSLEIPPVSEGSLQNTSGDCLSKTIKGIYKVGGMLTDSNFIEAQVTVTKPGSFVISSDTVNGMYFYVAGTVTNSGSNTIRIQGIGKPLTEGSTTLHLRYGNSTCPVVIDVLSASTTNAVFTLATATDGSCSGAVVSGTYTMGTAVTSANTVKLSVNVTTKGIYAINIPASNSVSFSASGIFTGTGVQDVTLTAAGTPAAAGDFNSTATAGTSTCTFTVSTVASTTPPATFTLGTTGSTCSGTVLAGTYTKDVAMTAANTAVIEVNVTAAGTYSLSTDAMNGVTFAAAGTFTSTGTQTVKLTAAGTPAAAGTNTFTITAGAATCTFIVTFTAPLGAAVYTLQGAPGSCSGALVNGTYQVSTALTTGNTAIIKVDVTTAGSYSITTNTVNGIRFSAAGTFTATGTGISVTLVGSGTPATEGPVTLTPAVGSSSCSFDVTVVAAPPEAPGIYHCKVDGVYMAFEDRAETTLFNPLTAQSWLANEGYSTATTSGFLPQLELFITNNDNSPVKPGVYDEKHFIPPGTYSIEVDLHLEMPDGSVVIWNTSSNFLDVNPPFTITVTSITSTRVKGTFSGQVTNTLQGSTARKTITEGVFDLPIH